jgi:hypothetical protein
MIDVRHPMVSRSARPGRAAVLMLTSEEGWERTAAGVLGSLSLTWGGAGGLVVPVSAAGPNPVFRPVVRAFDPDWIAAYRVTSPDVPRPDSDETGWVIDVLDEDVATVSDWCSPFPGSHGFHPCAFRGQAVGRPLVPLAAFPDAWDSEVADLDLSRVDPVLALMVTMRTGTLNDAGDLPDGCKPRLLTATPDDVPALAELALTGTAETRPSPSGSEVRHMRGLHAAPGVPAVSGISPVQPLERTMHGMRRLVDTRPRPWIVVAGDTCADFCFALACDRLLGGATWLPLSRLPAPVLDAGFPALSRLITSASTMSAMRVPVTSVSLDTAGVEAARELVRARGGAAFTDDHTEAMACGELTFAYPVRLGDPAHVTLAETSPAHRDNADGSLHVDSALLTPVPEVARRADANVTWQVDVRVEGEQPPARRVLGPGDLLSVIPRAEDLQVRAGTEALTYHSRSAMFTFVGSTLEISLARPRLRLPAAADVLSRLADAAGYDIRPSQTGRLNATLAGLWGGFSEAADDLGGPAWPLLRGLTPVNGEKDGPQAGRIVVHGVPYVTFAQAVALLSVTATQTREILDRLARRRILRRGLMLCCGRCNWLAWDPLEALGQDFQCQRCTHVNMIEQQLWREPYDEPAWFYDLDHAVREALRLNGRVPVLAASSLARQHPGAFSPTPDFEMIPHGADKPVVEIDLGAIGDGKVILCEAKSTSTLAASDIDEKRDTAKLITACRALTADILCLATTQPGWSPRTRPPSRPNATGPGSASFGSKGWAPPQSRPRPPKPAASACLRPRLAERAPPREGLAPIPYGPDVLDNAIAGATRDSASHAPL